MNLGNRTFVLPQGIKDFVPEKAEQIRLIENGLFEEFTKWGYRGVITPLFEYLDTITIGLGEELKSKLMKFVDPSTGEVVVLRPDITPQIGRLVATQLEANNSHIRLCYSGRVVKFEEKGSGKEREIFQVGCELLGSKVVECDAEVIALAFKSLEKLGLKGLVLDIGHSGILNIVLSSLGDLRNEFDTALRKRRFEKIEAILKKSDFDKKTQHLLIDLCTMSDNKNILKELRSKKVFKEYIIELEKVLEILDEYQINRNIIIDVGDIRGFNYYTGITFQVLFSNQKTYTPLVVGGRYDGLVQKYGRNIPATGFSIDVEQVLSVANINLVDNQVHFVVIPQNQKLRGKAVKIAQWLRANNYKVILDSNKNGELSKKFVKEPLVSYGTILVKNSEKIELIESRSGVKKEFSDLEMLFNGEV